MRREAGAAAQRYVDEAVSALRRMTEKRIRGYRSLGYLREPRQRHRIVRRPAGPGCVSSREA